MNRIVTLLLCASLLIVPTIGFAQNISICGHSMTPDQAQANIVARGDALSTPMWCKPSEQPFVNKIWRDYKFKYSTWTGSMGFNNFCDSYTPLTRLYNMMRVVSQVRVNANFPPNSYALWIVRDQQDYSKRVIDSTQGMCHFSSNPDALASELFDDIRYHKNIFTNRSSIATNSATIIHEARHAQGWVHVTNANGSQRDQSWAYDGAYKHSVVWLNNLYLYGNIEYLSQSKDACTENGLNHRGDNQTIHWDSMLTKGQALLTGKFIQRPSYVFKPRLCGWTLSEQPRNGG
jgi:hypothetical protein